MAITKVSNSGFAGTKYDTISADNNYMEPIASQLLGSTTSTVTFSNIPQEYKHLQIRITARLADATTDDNIYCQFNNDTGNNYATHGMRGFGAGTSVTQNISTSSLFAGRICGNSSTAGMFGISIFDILDYNNQNKFKTTRDIAGHDQNGSGQVWLQSGLWMSTSPIQSMKFSNGTGFTVNSRFSLYGIRG